MLILGVAIPGILAFAGILYAWSAIVLGLALAGVRIIRHPLRPWTIADFRSRSSFSWRAMPVLAVLACAWPQMVRPLLDGDSLSYHLPNAVAWVHGHGLWVTTTRYWWYPGGSELFAAGTFAVAGPFGLPVCGALALLLLSQRCYAFALRAALSPVMAVAISAVLVTAHTVALQSGNLENDVWLSAFLLEMLWCLRYERDAFVRTASVGTLIKPVGFAFVGLACLVLRAPLRAAAVAFAAFVGWLLRDLILFPNASVPLSASAFAHPEWTSIAAHGPAGLATLMHAILGDGLGFSLLSLALLIVLIIGPDRRLRVVAALFTVLFFIEPFGFNNAGPQLATGQSLRYFLPAIVFGTVGVLPFLRRLNAWFAIVFFAVALFEVRRFLAVFTADSLTHGTAAVVILAMIFFLIPNARMRRVGSGLLGLGLIAYAGRIAGTHPAGYYDDSLARAGVASAPFAWLRETRPQRVIAWSFRSGPVDIVTPHTDVIENYSGNACAAARQANALLLAIDDGNEPPDARTIARSCGHVVFESAAALIVQP